MTVCTDTSLIAQDITDNAKRVGLVRVVSNTPPPGQWVAIEEHRGSLKEDGGGVVEAERLPETAVDRSGVGDTIAWKVATAQSSALLKFRRH